ncbi:MAG TPA: hypothetical protein VHC19_24120 [Pirellulales bacterium]|nr:hypothetical protein [Pirellulales bacterium]
MNERFYAKIAAPRRNVATLCYGLGALLLSLAAPGCGGSPGAALVDVPVSGKVTLDGEPLPGAMIYFQSSNPAAFASLAGMTDDSGVYRLRTVTSQTSEFGGSYQVTISRMLKPDGSTLGPNEMPANVGATESLPPRYSMLGQSQLTAEVPAAGGAVDFELTSP